MPVILLANIDLEGKLCNGSQGTICAFEPISPENMPKVPQGRNYKKDPIGYLVAMKRYELTQRFIHSQDSCE
ncbi:hypothetical protein LZ30DRAFT_205789 [Colletotrichum cereale]|nr:hypothetical protein LZ30DRAFT_205789 [Colletotrichum cereale]